MQPWTGDSATRISPAGLVSLRTRFETIWGAITAPRQLTLFAEPEKVVNRPATGVTTRRPEEPDVTSTSPGSVGAGGWTSPATRPQMTDSQARAARILDVLIVRARLARGTRARIADVPCASGKRAESRGRAEFCGGRGRSGAGRVGWRDPMRPGNGARRLSPARAPRASSPGGSDQEGGGRPRVRE